MGTAVVCGLSVSASADYPHPRASDPWTVRVRVRKCTATTSPRIDRVRNCTVITGVQSPTCNPHVNEQSQTAEFYVTYKVQKLKVTPQAQLILCYYEIAKRKKNTTLEKFAKLISRYYVVIALNRDRPPHHLFTVCSYCSV